MSKSKLRQYKGDLDSTQIADGMNAARRNARRLADDAKLLLDAERFPTAAALAVLSIEESGKIMILDELAYAPETADRDKIWAKYRKHKSKNVVWFIPCVFVKGRVDQDGFRLVAENYAKISARLDQYKQISLYTGYLGNGNWSEPEKAMDLQLASLLVEIADQLAFEHTVTVKEIELRIEHLRPAYGASPEVWMKANKNFMVALFDNGLLEGANTSAEGFAIVRGGASTVVNLLMGSTMRA